MPRGASLVKKTLAEAHKSPLCPSLESVADAIHEKECQESKEEMYNNAGRYGADQREYRYKSALQSRANKAFVMASILANAGEKEIVQRELPAIIKHKSHECELWYIHDYMTRDGTDKNIDRYENVAELIASHASPEDMVHFLTHSIPGGCYGKSNAVCRNLYLKYAERLPEPHKDQLLNLALNSAREEFEEKIGSGYNIYSNDRDRERQERENRFRADIESVAEECAKLGDNLPKGRFYFRVGEYDKALEIFVARKEWAHAANTLDRMKGHEKQAAIYSYLAGNNEAAATRAERLGDIDMAMAMRNGTYVVDLDAYGAKQND